MPATAWTGGDLPAKLLACPGRFRLKSFAEGTKPRGASPTGTSSRGAAARAGRPERRGPAGTDARRAAADAGAAIAAYLAGWFWLGAATVADPALWCLALAAGAAVMVRAAGSVLRRKPRFSSPADRVTLGRAVVVACCAAVTAGGWITGAGSGGTVVLLGTTAFLLDAVDGRVARLTGYATAEGSRLDSDTDAALVLVLSCAAAGIFGLWPLAIGLMYYVFLAAAWFRPSLKRPLPVSTVRKVIGATQPAALLFALVPGVPAWLGAMVLGPALALLAYSFGRDVIALERLSVGPAAAARHPARSA